MIRVLIITYNEINQQHSMIGTTEFGGLNQWKQWSIRTTKFSSPP